GWLTAKTKETDNRYVDNGKSAAVYPLMNPSYKNKRNHNKQRPILSNPPFLSGGEYSGKCPPAKKVFF
ncbi:hypothetical protein, partial [Escherichia coli]